MEKEFVTYEQALTLGELSFNEECFIIDGLTKPTKQQVFRWFREKYEIYGIVGYYGKSQWSIEILNYKGNELLQIEDDFNTYEEAENACIDKLIEIAKEFKS